MADLSYTRTLIAGTPENINDVETKFNDVRTYVNGSGWVDSTRLGTGAALANLGDNTVTPAKIATVPHLKMHRSTTQSVPNNTTTAISYSTGNVTEAFDSDGMHDPATNPTRVTCKTAGLYSVTLRGHFNATGTGFLYLYKNGSPLEAPTVQFDGSTFEFTTLQRLVVDDYLEFYIYQNTGSAQNLTANVSHNKFEAVWLGP